MDEKVWVVSNPSPSAVGCPHPRPNAAEGRVDLQLAGFDFDVYTEDEYGLWLLSRGFRSLVDAGLLQVTQTTLGDLPKRKKQIPDSLKPENDFDHQMAFQIALAPEQTDDMQFARINLFRATDGESEWGANVDTTYLKTRHFSLLRAAEWYLTEFVGKRTPSQNRRLKDVRRQIRSIKSLM